jgi:hypothetical protein
MNAVAVTLASPKTAIASLLIVNAYIVAAVRVVYVCLSLSNFRVKAWMTVAVVAKPVKTVYMLKPLLEELC